MYSLIVGGCSGSNTPAFARPIFGHLTTSYGLLDQENKCGIVIDNGTGVQLVAKAMLSTGVEKTTVIQTHFHSDHLEGLQLNALLFGKTVVEIVVPELKAFAFQKPFADIWEERFHPTSWPVSPKTFGIEHSIRTFDGHKPTAFKLAGGVSVDTLPLNHPGGCVGYRFTMPDGKVFVIATDNELSDNDGTLRRDYGNFVEGANILIADLQYTQGEYEGKVALGGRAMSRKEWGHSTPEMLAETLSAYCKKWPLYIYATHHDPARDDEQIQGFGEVLMGVSRQFHLLGTTL